METEKISAFRHKLRELEIDLGLELKQDKCCFGLTLSQCHTLLEIGNKGGISLVELASALGLDSSTLSRTIDAMVRSGLVQRKLNPDDRRYVTISLSKKGKSIFERIENFYNKYFGQLFEFIPEAKRNQVIESFVLFWEAMKKCKKGRIEEEKC